MDFLHKGCLSTTRGFTYAYYSQPASKGSATVLLLHGWPDRATVWADLVKDYLLPAGFGVIVPDCLGYGDSDKPTEVKAYTSQSLSADCVEILDAEKIDQAFILGHDWGSYLASRLYLFFPERVTGLILMNVAYRPPSAVPFDLNKFNPLMQSVLGYSPFWYWELVLSDEGPKILEDHLESLWTILHGDGESMIATFGTQGGMKAYLLEDKTQDVQGYATDSRKVDFVQQFSRDGMAAPLCWYKAQAWNLHIEDEAKISEDLYVVRKPVLFIGGRYDKVGLTSGIYQAQKAGWLPELTVAEMDAGHWVMLARPKEVGEEVLNWLHRLARHEIS
jgi:soluble epoxide hydrolase / lipid-phosphate phosphatase